MSATLSEHLNKRPEFREPSRRARLSYLYSDLSQAKTNNPTSFQSAAAWWSNLIEEIVSQGLQDGGGDGATSSDKLIWHLDQEFCDRLRWQGAGRPTGLGTVAVSSNTIQFCYHTRLTTSRTDANDTSLSSGNYSSEDLPDFRQAYQSLFLAKMDSL